MQLIALGAGPDLLKKVLEAASQEVEHARVCFSTATYFSAEMVSPAGIPEIMSSQGATPSLRKLIEDCFFDGCIMESFSANLARKSSDLTTDSHSKNAFSLIARDEESHGELSWEILAFLIKEDKASVQSLRSQISLVRDISGPQMFPENISEQFRAVDENILRRFGILDQKIVIDIWSATLSKTEERIEKWLCAISSESDNCINLEAG